MSTTFAPHPWPAPTAPRPPAALRFGGELPLRRGGRELLAMRWELKRNCSLAPHQLIAVFVALCAAPLGIAVGFWMLGAPAVLPFAGVELLLLGALLVLHARHAGDRERLTLVGRELEVEHECGGRVRRATLRAEWVTVEPVHGEGSLVELAAQGSRVRVGRYLRPELRGALARELRQALRHDRDGRARQDKQREAQR